MQAKSLLPNDWYKYSVQEIACMAPIQKIQWPLLNEKGIELVVKRDDLLHPQLSGNKFYKLHGHIQQFLLSGMSVMASFGGAYSNHLYALAAAGLSLKVPTIGIIRGDEPASLSPTLQDVKAMGMSLIFVSRSDYRDKNSAIWRQRIEEQVSESVYWIPEGGGDCVGTEGCFEWAAQTIDMCPWRPTHLCVAAGTGATAAGILAACDDVPVHAFLALKGSKDDVALFGSNVISMATAVMERRSKSLVRPHHFYLETEYHCGGYAKLPEQLKVFQQDLEQKINVPLDPVYTAKLFWGIAQMAESGAWSEGAKLLVFHTGGLQGKRGYQL